MSDRYLLLGNILPGHHIPNMLGRIVADKTYPLDEYVPDEADEGGFNVREIVSNLYDEPVEYTDLQWVIGKAKNDDAKVKLTSIFDAHAGRRAAKTSKFNSSSVVRYSMTNIETKLKRMMKVEKYEQLAIELLQKNNRGTLPMVTGILTCRNTTVGKRDSREQEAGGELKAPVGKAMGASSRGDPSVELQHSKKEGKGTEQTITDEVIFALAYDEAKLTNLTKNRSSLWCLGGQEEQPKPKVVHGNKILGEGINIFSMPGEEDSEEDGTTLHGDEQAGSSKGGKSPVDFPFTIHVEGRTGKCD